MKTAKLELLIFENGETFLNYWDTIHGEDVCVEIIDGNIFTDPDEENKKPSTQISLKQFIDMVEKKDANRDSKYQDNAVNVAQNESV